MAADCIFCKIVDRSIPAELLHADEHCVAFRDIHPQAPTHVLVVPRLHVRDLPELCGPGDTGLEADASRQGLPGHLLRVANRVAQAEGLHERGFRLVINTGEHGGQSVAHLHIHVLGKRHLGWPPG